MGKKSIQKPEESAISKLKRIPKNPKSLSRTRSYRKPAKTADTNSRISSAPKIDRTERERERERSSHRHHVQETETSGSCNQIKTQNEVEKEQEEEEQINALFCLVFSPQKLQRKTRQYD
jgi:hypothetical protein